MNYIDKYDEAYVKYLEYHENAWSASTYKSEHSKLKIIVKVVRETGLNGADFFKSIKKLGYAPYFIKTLMQRAGSWYEFGARYKIFPSFSNPFRDFSKRNAQLFRHSYTVLKVKMDFDDAQEKINQIEDENMKLFCLALLHSGLRIHEAYKVNYEDSTVVGKGGKLRKVYFNYKGSVPPPSIYSVRSKLTELGLKPHDLRKLLATRLARHGMTHRDIMEVMGWSSIETASKYFQPEAQEKLKLKINEAILGGN